MDLGFRINTTDTFKCPEPSSLESDSLEINFFNLYKAQSYSQTGFRFSPKIMAPSDPDYANLISKHLTITRIGTVSLGVSILTLSLVCVTLISSANCSPRVFGASTLEIPFGS